ncbi:MULTISPECIES: hypothetical protein [Rhodococcus]|uniref:hypothetical protein n=1 Tax=Rhodococcus TaxID=1827 RepID=UPI001E47E7CD|nr:hypothetical protein [Rhodococcus pyridinivorans]MCD2117096.1 hypothetical protein [Rhodococcus pyridinivorans]MCZ4626062.1 hypothetical protein [Rhodococcus pyridinivorans]MCZ4647172.1 hypothetical protein [Rhodococcus pyridinivorans]MDJ0483577.1 hypothetical protein [Rhodococcus pyridinivorans]MDV7253121.1 hypothetical protein [Rhodococcus pyridinivorans]
MTESQQAPSPRTERGGGAAGVDQALANAHPDLMTLARQWLSTLSTGAEFTGAQLAEHLPGYVVDHRGRPGAAVTNLARAGLIEFAGYAARAADGGWDRPARLWRRTDVPIEDGEV